MAANGGVLVVVLASLLAHTNIGKKYQKTIKNMPPIQKERWSVSLNKQGASPHKEISNKSESFEFKYDP